MAPTAHLAIMVPSSAVEPSERPSSGKAGDELADRPFEDLRMGRSDAVSGPIHSLVVTKRRRDRGCHLVSAFDRADRVLGSGDDEHRAIDGREVTAEVEPDLLAQGEVQKTSKWPRTSTKILAPPTKTVATRSPSYVRGVRSVSSSV